MCRGHGKLKLSLIILASLIQRSPEIHFFILHTINRKMLSFFVYNGITNNGAVCLNLLPRYPYRYMYHTIPKNKTGASFCACYIHHNQLTLRLLSNKKMFIETLGSLQYSYSYIVYRFLALDYAAVNSPLRHSRALSDSRLILDGTSGLQHLEVDSQKLLAAQLSLSFQVY